MKNLAYILFLFPFVSCKGAGTIDNLKTINDVNKFISAKVDNNWIKTIQLSEKKANSIKEKNYFQKLDINDDGVTDLLVNEGELLFAIIDNKNGKFSLYILSNEPIGRNFEFIKTIYISKQSLLLIKNNNSINNDTLIFKFGNFIEYNSHPKNLQIAEISFSASGCFGKCPIFSINISKDKSERLNAIRYNEIQGEFKAEIDSNSYNRLIQTINYLNIRNLNENYQVGWTDDQTATLTLKYDNGDIKKIIDYGMIGTFGLSNLYKQLFDLRTNQHWHK